jgi:hypothetical protein
MSKPNNGSNDQAECDTEGEELSLIRHVSSLVRIYATFDATPIVNKTWRFATKAGAD